MSFAKLGSQHTVNTTIAGDQYGSAVTQLLNGDIVVAWTDTNGTAINVRGQILNANGVTRDGSSLVRRVQGATWPWLAKSIPSTLGDGQSTR